MMTVYAICAVVGSVVLVAQFLMIVAGLDSDQHDIAAVGDDLAMGDDLVDHHHHDASWFFGILSFKSVIAALAFFGLGGLAGLEAGLSPYLTFIGAIAAGTVAMFAVAWLLRMFSQLKSEGNVRIERCIGMAGTVYLGIPGQRSGAGKVTVSVQNRSMEYQAVTEDDEELPTGARVMVVGVVGTDTLEVAAEKPAVLREPSEEADAAKA